MRTKVSLSCILWLTLFLSVVNFHGVSAFIVTRSKTNNIIAARSDGNIFNSYQEKLRINENFLNGKEKLYSIRPTGVGGGKEQDICQNNRRERRKQVLKKFISSFSLSMSLLLVFGNIDFPSSIMKNNFSPFFVSSKIISTKANAATVFGIDITPKAPSVNTEPAKLELVNYEEPTGLFHTNLPKSFYSKRKGDNDGILFISGEFSKGIAMSVEKVSLSDIFAENGLEAQGYDTLKTWKDVGTEKGVSELLATHREYTGSQGKKQPFVINEASVKVDDKTFVFEFDIELKVQRPDLLLKETGKSKLIRRTVAKAILQPEGKMMIMWGSAIENDFDAGYGDVLRNCVNSFNI